MKHRTTVPEDKAVALLVANQRACCICHKRKQVIIHHNDDDPSNHAIENLALVCLDCHGRVTGDEGLGRRYTPAEVTAHKRTWEQKCAAELPEDYEEEEEPAEPTPVLYETTLLSSDENTAYDFELERGDELFVAISASGSLDAFICDPPDYDLWLKSGETDVYEDAEHVRGTRLRFEAPRTATYTLVLANFSGEEIEVTVEAAVSGCGDED